MDWPAATAAQDTGQPCAKWVWTPNRKSGPRGAGGPEDGGGEEGGVDDGGGVDDDGGGDEGAEGAALEDPVEDPPQPAHASNPARRMILPRCMKRLRSVMIRLLRGAVRPPLWWNVTFA
jgi:hypothetical protein